MEHKRYALLENGSIAPLKYSDGSLRWIEFEDDEYYLYHDVWTGSALALCRDKIIKEADNLEELKNDR